MKNTKQLYHGYRYPPQIISHAVWLYYRFCLSFRDVEDLLAESEVIVSYETIRQWCNRFGPKYARALKKRSGCRGDTRFLDVVFVKIGGELHYLWRDVNQDGDTLDILIQRYRNKKAAKRFFRKLLKGQNATSRLMVTDKFRSYAAARREIMPSVNHSTEQYENNRAELSPQPTRQRERQMRRFKSVGQAQRFLSVHGEVGKLFRLSHHLTKAVYYRVFRSQAFAEWRQVTCA